MSRNHKEQLGKISLKLQRQHLPLMITKSGQVGLKARSTGGTSSRTGDLVNGPGLVRSRVLKEKLPIT